MNSIASLPKVELHCHLDGSLTLDFVQSTLAERGETVDRHTLLQQLRCPDDCGSLAQYLQRFDLPIRCMQTPVEVAEAAYTFVHSLVADNVIYAEVRFSPELLANPRMHQRQALEAVLEGLAAGQRDFGIETGVIICAMRHHSPAQNLAAYRLAGDYRSAGVCGVDLAGDEAAYPNRHFAELFVEAQRLGLPYTIHAGECGNAKSVRDALTLGAHRIGHGIAMGGNSALQELCARRQVGVEMCPVSNFQTKAVVNREDYPIRAFLQNGLLVTVNTDNRMVSGTSLTREFTLLQEEYSFTFHELNQLTRNAIEASFASPTQKERLLRHRLLTI